MTDEIDVLRKTIMNYDDSIHLKKLNEELYSHLTGSIYYLLQYSEKYGIPLPKKDELVGMITKSDFIIDRMSDHPTTFDTDKNRRQLDGIRHRHL